MTHAIIPTLFNIICCLMKSQKIITSSTIKQCACKFCDLKYSKLIVCKKHIFVQFRETIWLQQRTKYILTGPYNYILKLTKAIDMLK